MVPIHPLAEGSGVLGTKLVIDGNEILGQVVQKNSKKLYISIRHRIDLETAVKIAEDYTLNHFLPEPLYLAHKLAGGKRILPPSLY